MTKNKPRHNPNKPQNKYGDWCQFAEESDGQIFCETSYDDTKICKGNRHNCVQTMYHKMASRKE